MIVKVQNHINQQEGQTKISNVILYRAIHNLQSIENIFEELIKLNLQKCPKENDIILRDHHSGISKDINRLSIYKKH